MIVAIFNIFHKCLYEASIFGSYNQGEFYQLHKLQSMTVAFDIKYNYFIGLELLELCDYKGCTKLQERIKQALRGGAQNMLSNLSGAVKVTRNS